MRIQRKWHEVKFWDWFLLALMLIALILGFAAKAKAEDTYGSAYFWNPIYWDRSNLKGHWVMSPEMTGDYLSGLGDFELPWTGPEGGCTNCPAGWVCSCPAGDIDQEITKIYKSSTSVALKPAGAFQPLLSDGQDFLANKVYQLSFCYRGEDGTEDFLLAASDPGITETYDPATDTWTAPATGIYLTDAPTTWTCDVMHIKTGPVTKTSYIYGFAAVTGDGSSLYIDNVQFRELKTGGVVGQLGNVLSVAGDPVFSESPELLHKPGSGPVTRRGMKADGVDDYVYCADADCPMDPILWDSGGKFSVGCRLITGTVVAGTNYIIDKWGAVGVRSWSLYRSTANLGFAISDDGTNIDTNSAAMFTVDALHSFVSTFDPSGGSGACENNLYYNAYQVVTDATMTECAPFDSTAGLQIGAQLGASTWSGSMLECTLWDGKLSAIQSNKYISPYYPATTHGEGFFTHTCSQSASPAVCSTQTCRDGAPNSCQAEGTGVMSAFGQKTTKLDNNGFSTLTGDDSDPTFTGWDKSGVAGDGSYSVTAYRADSIYGGVSVRMKLTGTTSSAALERCITVNGNTSHYGFLKAKELAGVAKFTVRVNEYSGAGCTTFVKTDYIANAVGVDETWQEFGAAFTTDATTVSAKIVVTAHDSATDLLLDTIDLKEAAYRTPWIPCPAGSGTCTATAHDLRLDNPLARFAEAEQKYGYEDGFCLGMWTFTDWAGDDGVTHNILFIPPTAGTNNRMVLHKYSNNVFYFEVFDSTGATLYYTTSVTNTNWTAGGGGKYVEVCSSNTGTLAARHYNYSNSTWYTWTGPTGAGTGIQDGQSDELHIGHEAVTDFLDGYIPEIHLSPYPSGAFVWPQKGFRSGKPPKNGRPY